MNVTKDFWDKTYKENAPKMIGICRRYVIDREIAEDLMQDAFITAMQKFDTFSRKGHFDAWLRKIAVNKALMYLRHQNAQKIHDDVWQHESENQEMDEPNLNDVRAVVEYADFTEVELLGIIDQLPEHHRLVFNMYVIDNYTHVQIGKELNISAGTSKSHLARARKKVQQLLLEKALEQNRHKKKKQRATLFFIFGGKTKRIDRLFKNKLQHYTIQPVKNSMYFLDAVNWNIASIPKISSIFFTVKTLLWIAGISSGVMISAVVYNHYQNAANPVHQEQIPLVLDSTNRTQENDSIYQKPAIEEELVMKTAKEEQKSSEPVIIKKQIIQRKLVTIRDTIKITDTTNAK